MLTGTLFTGTLTMSRTLADMLYQERKRVGIRENPMGSNRTSVGVEFGWNGVAWCAETVSVCLIDAGFKIRKNASAAGLAEELVRMGWKRVSSGSVRQGDIVKYTFSHIGFCEARRDSGHIVAIEGNHADRCMRVTRANSSIDYGVRPPYVPSVPGPVGPRGVAGFHTHVKVIKAGTLYNGTGGTERKPAPGVGGIVAYRGNARTMHDKRYVLISWGGNKDGGWFPYDYLRWVPKGTRL